MKRMICMTLTLAVGSVLAADVTYTEPPADTSMIRVEEGTTTVAGLEAYSHLTHYWSFDDENDPYADSVGNLPLVARSNDPVWKTGEDAKRGGAMWTADGFKAPTNFIDGKHPFTICFWYKYGDFSGNSAGQESLLHVGKAPKGDQISDTPYFRVSHHNNGNPTRIDFWDNQITYKNQPITAFTSNVWHHIALVCEVVEMPDCAVSNKFTVFRNGSATDVSAKLAQQELASTDYFLIGFGWKYGGGSAPVYDATFDEVMSFDRALTGDEIKAFAAYSAPVDFSAGWDIAADGTLKIAGINPLTALRGHGLCETVEGTRLESSSNDWFAGTISSPGFTFAGVEGVRQGLLGANVYSGATTVESGTLEVASTPMQLFGEALVAWYPFDDAANPGRDFSPRGNNLSPNTGFDYEALSAEGPLAGSGLMMSMTNCTAGSSGMSSTGRLNGFAENENNSFTVAFWMRDDEGHDKEGPFSFSYATGFRRNRGDTAAKTYWGDTSGPMISVTGDKVWGNGEWHHWVMMFDAVAAEEEGKICYFLFKDGVLNASSSNWNKTTYGTSHATQRFNLGRGMSPNLTDIFDAALDEVIVLNTANTNDVEKLYDFRRTQPETATGVLPTGTAVTVKEGATLKLAAANETVAQLYGKGTIDLSGNSKLTVTTKDRFEGTVIGGKITDEPGAERQGLVILVK